MKRYIVVKPWLPGKRESLIVDMCMSMINVCTQLYTYILYLYKLTAVFSDVVTGLVGCQTLQNFSPDTRTMVTVSGCVVLEAAVGVTHQISTPTRSGAFCVVTSWGNRGFGPHLQPETKRGCDMTKN